MPVETFTPSTVAVSPEAAAHLLRQLAKSGQRALRLGVRESGCNGYMYALDYIDEPAGDDQAFAVAPGLDVHVRRSELPLVAGTQVEIVNEGLNSSLRFKNPNATAHCGCGESFSLAEATGAGAGQSA